MKGINQRKLVSKTLEDSHQVEKMVHHDDIIKNLTSLQI